MTDPTITLAGWTHVHTWHESHGSHIEETYQCAGSGRWRPPECLVVSIYRDGRPSRVRTESGNDYLMARTIRANDAARFTQDGARVISPCFTSGHVDWTDTLTGERWRVISVAGHGAWAVRLGEGD